MLGWAHHGLNYQRISPRPVIALAGDEPDADGIATGHEPKAVVLDLVNPIGPGRGPVRGGRRQGSMKLARSAARLRIRSIDMPLI